MHCSYILFQLFTRFIGEFYPYKHTELLPGSYLMVCLSEEALSLENLDSEVDFDKINSPSSSIDKALRFVLANAQDLETSACVPGLQIEELNAYIEARHGVKVFESGALDQCLDEPILYFFPRRVFKLRKVIPPSPAQ